MSNPSVKVKPRKATERDTSMKLDATSDIIREQVIHVTLDPEQIDHDVTTVRVVITALAPYNSGATQRSQQKSVTLRNPNK